MHLISLYIIALGVLGEITDGILWADLLLPLVAFAVVIRPRFTGAEIAATAGFLCFTWCSSLIYVLLGELYWFYPFAISLRVTAFTLLLLYGIAVARRRPDKGPEWALYLVILLAAVVTAQNFFSDTRAYYGYAQIVSSGAPAISAFFLGGVSAYLFFESYKKRSVLRLLFSILAGVLALSTFSLSGSVALVAAVFVGTGLIVISHNSQKIKLLFGSLLVVCIGLVTVLWNVLNGLFYRFDVIIGKLEYRLNKVESATNDVCTDLFCKIVGAGPGAHSDYIAIAYGEGSILGFDQLYGRILLEWGLFGSFLWLLFIVVLLKPARLKNRNLKINIGVSGLLVYGLFFGVGSEFLFVSYSGSIYALLVGITAGREKVKSSQTRPMFQKPIKRGLRPNLRQEALSDGPLHLRSSNV